MSRQRRLEVMADPAVGAFGAVTLVRRPRAPLRRLRVDGGRPPRRRRAVVRVAHGHGRGGPVPRPTRVPGGLATAFVDRRRRPRPAGVRRRRRCRRAGPGGRRRWRSGMAVVGRGRPRRWPRWAPSWLAMAVVVVLAQRRIGGFTGDVLGAAGVVGETIGLLVLAAKMVSTPRRRRRRRRSAIACRAPGRPSGRSRVSASRRRAAPGAALRALSWTHVEATAVPRRSRRRGRPRRVGDGTGRGRGCGRRLHRRRHLPRRGGPGAARRRGVDRRRARVRRTSNAPGQLLPEPGRARRGATSTRSDMARAVVESVAENTVDAVVAPAWWAAVAGAPGVLGYRAVNTMDAMVGHRNDRYLRYGWASARLDDVAAFVPARMTAVLVAAVRPRAAPGDLAGRADPGAVASVSQRRRGRSRLRGRPRPPPRRREPLRRRHRAPPRARCRAAPPSPVTSGVPWSCPRT